MKHCPILSDNGGPCPNSYLAVCPDFGKAGKCREVGIDEVVETVRAGKPNKKKEEVKDSIGL